MTNLFASAETSSAASGAETSFIVIFALLSVAILLPVIWLLTKYMRKPKYAQVYKANLQAHTEAPDKKPKPVKFNFTGILFAIIGIGLIVRLVLAFTVTGYRNDFSDLYGMYFESGGSFGGTYANGNLNNLNYPLVAYMYSFFGMLARAFGMSANSLATPLFIKLPLILADIGLILLVYRAAKKHINEYAALTLAGFTALFPPFIIASSVWGSVYSLLALFIALSFYFLANKKFALMFIAYGLALYTVRDALYLFPIFAVFVVYQFIKAIKYTRNNNVRGIKNIIKDKEARPVLSMPAYTLAAMLIMYLVALPLLTEHGTGFFQWMGLFYIRPIANTQFFGYNAMNVFNLFTRNGIALGLEFPGALFGWLFMVIITGLVLLVYISRKNRANMIYLGAYILLTLSVYFVDFTAMNILAVLALFILALIFVRDRRILLIIGALGLLFTLNASFIFLNAGYLNNQPLSSAFGEVLLDSGGYMIANIICSAGVILVHAYATIVILDIAMSNRRKLFADISEPVKFGTSLKKFIKS
ncbi:MAG: hypothetical protein FWH03_00415 [Firmicutes bacterium]|nr:hypothetical protein [Bacillota bacterium]